MERLGEMVKFKNFKKLFYFFLLSLFLISCGKAEYTEFSSLKQLDGTILMYIAANNDLKYDGLKSIDQLESVYHEGMGELLVYVKVDRYFSHLLKIKKGSKDGIVESDTIKSYGSENSSSEDFMKLVFQDMISIASNKIQGVILWSHGTSWLPSNFRSLKTKSFGSDRGLELDIKSLVNILPGDLNFILFDACYMASVEVVYELRDKAKYIIASSSEILSSGYPYDLVLSDLFKGNLLNVCKIFFNYYNVQEDEKQSCTVSLINTEHLDELSQIYHNMNVMSKLKFKSIITHTTQDFNFIKEFEFSFYDFGSIVNVNYLESNLYNFNQILDKCIEYRTNTDYFLGFPIRNSTGLTISIVEDPNLLTYYKTLAWYKDAGLNYLYNIN